MTDLETLQKIQQALVTGLVAVQFHKNLPDKEEELEQALDLLRPIIVKEMFKGQVVIDKYLDLREAEQRKQRHLKLNK